MIKVKILAPASSFPLIRQTPGASGKIGDYEFCLNDADGEFDYWVVLNDLSKTRSFRLMSGKTILITGEPPAIKTYHEKFIKQFSRIVCCDRSIKHPSANYYQQGLPWMLGCKFNPETKLWDDVNYLTVDDFRQTLKVEKKPILSIITSNKKATQGHNDRLVFVEKLKEILGDLMEIRGVGINPVIDKGDVMLPCQYSLAIENSSYPDYWTEKLADSFLAECYPFYYGCPNIYDYFSEKSLTIIDIDNVEKTAEIIKQAINNCLYEKSIEAIRDSKQLILSKYNLFNLIIEQIEGLKENHESKRITLKPEKEFISKTKRLKNKIKFLKEKYVGASNYFN